MAYAAALTLSDFCPTSAKRRKRWDSAYSTLSGQVGKNSQGGAAREAFCRKAKRSGGGEAAAQPLST